MGTKIIKSINEDIVPNTKSKNNKEDMKTIKKA
jgi:hypothetical protein